MGLAGVERVVDQAIDQRSFADTALTNQEKFGFVEGTNITAAKLTDIVENGFYRTGIFGKVW